MRLIGKITLIAALAMALTSCSVFAPSPTQTPLPTATTLPTSTATPVPTVTPMPTKTRVPPTDTPAAIDFPMPTGKPVTTWEGIPVMPAAIAGDGDSAGYRFTVEASPEDALTFYENEMAKSGWTLLAAGRDDAGNPKLLIFMKEAATASIAFIPQPDGILFVLLVK